MQTLNESQVLIQNTKTGRQSIVTKHYFEQVKKSNKVSPFHDFEIVPTPSANEQVEGETKPVKKSKSN